MAGGTDERIAEEAGTDCYKMFSTRKDGRCPFFGKTKTKQVQRCNRPRNTKRIGGIYWAEP